MAGIGAGTAGLTTSLNYHQSLSKDLTESLEEMATSLIPVQNQLDSPAVVVLQNRRGLGLLTAEKGVLSLFLEHSAPSVFAHLFSHSVVFGPLWPHELQHARLPCPSPSPRACSNSCPLSHWCNPTISSSVVHFSSCLQSFPASGFFPMSQLFIWGGQSTGASALG